MQIVRLARDKFKALMISKDINDSNVADSNDFYICINSTGWIHGVPYFKESHKNVINLYFDDVEISGPKEIQWFGGSTKTIDAVAMDKSQATELYDFIKEIPESSIVYVYCAKGKSRSGAVEDFLEGLTTPREGSNAHVFNSLKKVKDARL